MKKVKRLTAVILSALMVASAFSALPVSAATVDNSTSVVSGDDNDYRCFFLDDGTLEISEYVGSDTDVIIPNEINGTAVTSIGKYVFSYNSNIDSVTIPDSVTNIGYGAFRGSSITSIKIPNSVTRICTGAFSECAKLTSITIPDSVTEINGYAFSECTKLTNITIPKSVTCIASNTFSDCSSLKSVTIPNGVTSIDEGAFSDCTKLASITIPNSVTSIGKGTFSGCSSLKSIMVPNGVVSIGEFAFENCSSLTNIEIPNSVTSIGWDAFSNTNWYNNHSDGLIIVGKVLYKYKGIMPNNTDIIIPEGTVAISKDAFYECNGLRSVSIPDSVTNIGEAVFDGCSNLASINLPNSITCISNNIFWGCSKLSSITIPSSVTSIGYNAFVDCSSLKSITIPDSVTSIGSNAFGGCSNLKSITTSDNISYIGEYAFDSTPWYDNQPDGLVYIGKVLYSYKGNMPKNTNLTIPDGIVSISGHALSSSSCSNLTNISLPDSITDIGDFAFFECTNLNNIKFPNNIKNIGECAFFGCLKFTSIKIPGSIKFIDVDAFYCCDNLLSVYLPNADFEIPLSAFGYKFGREQIEGFKLYGYEGTCAERYALNWGLTFVPIVDSVLTDAASNIIVSGAIKENTTLSVKKLENTFENHIATYDISLQKDGATVQPDGLITIKIPSKVKNCTVMWQKENGGLENMLTEYIDGYYVFKTNHIGVYALFEFDVFGDVNQDFDVNVNDVTYFQRYISGAKNEEGTPLIDENDKILFKCIDLNYNGKLDVQDITALQVFITENTY